MSDMTALLSGALEFTRRQPQLSSSGQLKRESEALFKALEKYCSKADEIEVSLTSGFAETLTLIEGSGKAIATREFIKEFSGSHLSSALSPTKSDKKARRDLVILAAKEGKLKRLRIDLDPAQKFRKMLLDLLKQDDKAITEKVMNMTPNVFRGIVASNGFDATHTATGAISTSQPTRKKVLKQILHMAASERCLSSFGDES